MKDKFYKFLISNAPVGYCYRRILCDEEGMAYDYEIVEVNQAFEAITGKTAEELVGKTGRQLGLDDGDEPIDWLEFYKSVALSQSCAIVDRYSNLTRKYHRLHVYSPEKYYFATFYTDITHEIVELKELEKFFSLSLDLLSISDFNGRIVKVNNQWETTFGYSTDELANMNLNDLIHEDDLEATKAVRKDLARGLPLSNHVNRLHRKDGAFRYIEWRACPSNNLIYASARDVTDMMMEKQSIIKFAGLPSKILDMDMEKIDIHDLLAIVAEISGAKAVLLNMVQDDGGKLKLIDIAGEEAVIDSLKELFGHDPIGMLWSGMPEYMGTANDGSVLLFSSFDKYAESCFLQSKGEKIEHGHDIGEIAIVKIIGSNHTIGDFTLMMPVGISIKGNELAETIIRQLGMIISRKEAEHALKKSEERFRTIFEEAPLGIGLFEFNSGRARQVNSKFAEIVGRSREEMQHLDWQSITHPDDMELNNAKRELLIAGKISGFTINKRYFRPDGSIVWINLTIVPLWDEDTEVPLELCMIEDITERKNWEEEIIYLNYHDALTGLYNRTFLDEEKKRLNVDRQLPLSVIMGDINGLKLVNDAFGHAEGDKLLKEVSRILVHCCRAEDIVARTGGDEFCILLPATTAETASDICRRITALCGEYRHLTGSDAFYPGIALGCATKNHLEESIEKIINEAEDAMYKKKLLERKSIHSSIIASIRTAMFEKSYETEQHAERMVALSEAMGQILGLTDRQMNDLHLLATLHDLGKVSIDDHILTKKGPLTDEEWQIMRKHPEIGYRIANASIELAGIADYILCHHEKWDGSGYPQGLSGESIPLLSRIISVVDAFDAMTEDRPYRKAMDNETAIAELRKNAGSQFDPKIAMIFADHVAPFVQK